jgi:hypothetical protein
MSVGMIIECVRLTQPVIKLTIRRAQLEAFRQGLIDALHLRLVRDLRRVSPQQTASMSDEELTALCSREGPIARTYGIVAEDDLRRYLVLVLRHGPGFGVHAETSWAGSILRRRDLEAHAKLNLIDEYERFGPQSSKS